MKDFSQTFLTEVLTGLRKDPKRLSSKYFYDDLGSKIFQEIMDMPEYYLPQAELEIIRTYSGKIADKMGREPLDVIELGAGDGRKIVHLIKSLSLQVSQLTYIPLDISDKALVLNEELMKSENPGIKFEGIAGDYYQTYSQLRKRGIRKLVIFAGSNIGNFSRKESVEFLRFLKNGLEPGDYLIVGVDLKKNPRQILKAYDDPQGITKRFNLNLLQRINRELDANFNLQSFDHYATYHPITGACESFLVSLENQEVSIGKEVIGFKKNEVIQTEISQKFDQKLLKQLAEEAAFELEHFYTDSKGYFSWVLFKR